MSEPETMDNQHKSYRQVAEPVGGRSAGMALARRMVIFTKGVCQGYLVHGLCADHVFFWLCARRRSSGLCLVLEAGHSIRLLMSASYRRFYRLCRPWSSISGCGCAPLFGEFMVPPGPVDELHGDDRLSEWHADLKGFFEIATLYTMVAGLLNMLSRCMTLLQVLFFRIRMRSRNVVHPASTMRWVPMLSRFQADTWREA